MVDTVKGLFEIDEVDTQWVVPSCSMMFLNAKI